MSYKLTPDGINAAVTEVESYLTERKKDKKDVLRVRLGLEEALLRYREQFGEETEFFTKCGKSLGRTKISVSLRGAAFDPFSQPGDAESSSAFMRAALVAMGDLPVWKYLNGTNEVYFTLSRESMPEWTHLIIAIGSALLVGFFMQYVPAEVREFIRNDVLAPVSDTFMNLLGAISGPMIFLATVWGIYSIGDAVTFSTLGKRLAGRYIVCIVGLTVLFTPCCIPFLSLTAGAAVGEGNLFSIILRMLLQIVPGNIFEPFLSGNTLQILFLGITMGVAMIFISEKTQTVALFAEQLNYIVQIIMDFISRLVPLFVFNSILNIVIGNQLSSLMGAYKLLAFNLMGSAIIFAVITLLLLVRVKMSPARFWKKASATFLIALTTASSAAAFGTNINTCMEQYGIRKNLTNFGVPFGQIIFKPATALLYLSTALYMAECYQVPVSAVWMVTVIFMGILLSIATPPIPGGLLASVSVLFVQLGIPADGIAVFIALNVILDFVTTSENLVTGQAMLILAAKSAGLLDEDILLDRVKKN